MKGGRRRLAFVSSRYGPEILGGAEAVLRELAVRLHGRGWIVEVLTTTARDLYTFRSELPPGLASEDGIPVRRFPAIPQNPDGDPIGHLILSGARPSLNQQMDWMNTRARSPLLFEFLVDHADGYDLIVCGPYHAWTSFACVEAAPSKTIVMPALHDEPFARLDIFRPTFEGVRGLWFLSVPERALAKRLFPLTQHAELIGSGIDAPTAYDPGAFRARYGIDGEFLLFAGRREAMKGWNDLLANVSFANDALGHGWQLATCGGGSIGDVPGNVVVRDLGFIPDQDRSDAFAAATAYIQPSALESFSRTIMEAWLAGTLVIANDESAVVRWHTERSKAGLTYRDRYEFAECLRLLCEDPAGCEDIARGGRAYVLASHDWNDVIDRAEQSLRALT